MLSVGAARHSRLVPHLVTIEPPRALVEKAAEMQCTQRVFVRADEHLAIAQAVVGKNAVRSDAAIDARTTQQYHLAHSPELHYLPLTRLQATRVNAALAGKKKPDDLLSPDQRRQADRIRELLARDPKRLAALTPDRSPEGIAKYAGLLEAALKN